MTKRERLLAVLRGEMPDRVPMWTLFPYDRMASYVDVYNLPAYSEIAPYIRQHTEFFHRKSIPAPFLYTAAARTEHATTVENGEQVTRSWVHTPYGVLTAEAHHDSGDSTHWDTEHLFKEIEDLDKALAIPYEPALPDLTEFLAAAEGFGEEGLMMAGLPIPVSSIYENTAPETFALWIGSEMSTILRFLDTVFGRQYRFLEEALRRGAGPVFFATGTEFPAPPMASPATFARLCTHYNVPLFDLVHRYGGYVIVHHHGKARAVLQQIVDAGADGIQPIEEPPVGDMPLAEAKKIMAGRSCIVGSIQYDDIARLPDDEFETLVRRQIRDAAPGGGFILAPTAGPYQASISAQHVRNLRRMIDLVHEYGVYPLKNDI